MELTHERIAELRRMIHPQHDVVTIRRETLEALLDEIEPQQPEPDSCIECDQEAVGVDETGTPYCAAHYRRRPSIPDRPRPVTPTGETK